MAGWGMNQPMLGKVGHPAKGNADWQRESPWAHFLLGLSPGMLTSTELGGSW